MIKADGSLSLAQTKSETETEQVTPEPFDPQHDFIKGKIDELALAEYHLVQDLLTPEKEMNEMN